MLLSSAAKLEKACCGSDAAAASGQGQQRCCAFISAADLRAACECGSMFAPATGLSISLAMTAPSSLHALGISKIIVLTAMLAAIAIASLLSML